MGVGKCHRRQCGWQSRSGCLSSVASSKEREQLKPGIYIPSSLEGRKQRQGLGLGQGADGASAGWILLWELGVIWGMSQRCVTVCVRERERSGNKYTWVYVGISPLAKLRKYRQGYSKPPPFPASMRP